MKFDGIREWLGESMSKPLFTLAGTEVTFYSIITFIVIILLTRLSSTALILELTSQMNPRNLMEDRQFLMCLCTT